MPRNSLSSKTIVTRGNIRTLDHLSMVWLILSLIKTGSCTKIPFWASQEWLILYKIITIPKTCQQHFQPISRTIYYQIIHDPTRLTTLLMAWMAPIIKIYFYKDHITIHHPCTLLHIETWMKLTYLAVLPIWDRCPRQPRHSLRVMKRMRWSRKGLCSGIQHQFTTSAQGTRHLTSNLSKSMHPSKIASVKDRVSRLSKLTVSAKPRLHCSHYHHNFSYRLTILNQR